MKEEYFTVVYKRSKGAYAWHVGDEVFAESKFPKNIIDSNRAIRFLKMSRVFYEFVGKHSYIISDNLSTAPYEYRFKVSVD